MQFQVCTSTESMFFKGVNLRKFDHWTSSKPLRGPLVRERVSWWHSRWRENKPKARCQPLTFGGLGLSTWHNPQLSVPKRSARTLWTRPWSSMPGSSPPTGFEAWSLQWIQSMESSALLALCRTSPRSWKKLGTRSSFTGCCPRSRTCFLQTSAPPRTSRCDLLCLDQLSQFVIKPLFKKW